MAPRIVIDEREPRPWLRWAIAGAVAVVVGLLLWGGYGLALSVAGGDWAKMRARAQDLASERTALQEQAAQLERENQRLREQLTFTERSAEIDQMACATVRASLKELESELAELREQVVFYRDIVQPDETRAGLRVHAVSLRALSEERHFTTVVTLVQSVRGNRSVSGRASIVIDGLQGDEPLRLNLGELKSGDAGGFDFSFKFFQEIAVDFALPEGFIPSRMVISADPQGANNRIERQFDWDEILRG
ncbi:DUF6776 family protein [Abyssibacter profundi]|uniref:Uncharacterized protein n=1 Tax=Abyssibacter profundi TaxID=2182787 RepID=A0A363UKN5_9GAMM|nr:DUF6776 family protein [Abyssibacter profundi]PWN55974.1 hypothetical protein DEH80_09130 [Abyssibacter profundi]